MKLDPIPSSAMPLTAGNSITMVWLRWLGQFVLPPGPIVEVDVSTSPMTYTASETGSLAISGGTVTDVTLTRTTTSGRTGATNTTQTGITGGIVPMSNNDSVTITYAVAPTSVTFIPG